MWQSVLSFVSLAAHNVKNLKVLLFDPDLAAATVSIRFISYVIDILTNFSFSFLSHQPSLTIFLRQGHAAHATSTSIHWSRLSLCCYTVCVWPGLHCTVDSSQYLPSLIIPSVFLRLHQVRLTEDLASSVARLSQLQLEASAHQQKAMELQSKLNSVLQDSESQCQHITVLEKQLEGLCWCCFYWYGKLWKIKFNLKNVSVHKSGPWSIEVRRIVQNKSCCIIE